MKKFGINSLDDLKTDADKKKFFKHVDSTHTADHEEVKEAYLPPVKYGVAKRSKTRTGLRNQVEVDEIFSQSQMKQAIGIARKSSGNYTKAYNEIEKIKKGLGDEHIIQNALKKANESFSEGHDCENEHPGVSHESWKSKEKKEMKQESRKYHDTKPGSIQDTVAQMQVNEQKSVTVRVKELSALIETYLAKGGVSRNLSPVIAEKELSGVLPLQAVREFIGTYNRHFLTNYKAEEFIVREG
jgi:hypothetical protein